MEIKAKNLCYGSIMYAVFVSKIQKVPVKEMLASNNWPNQLKINGLYFAHFEETKATSDNGSVLYFNLEDARIEQAARREKYINDLYKAAAEAFEKYNMAVAQYLYAPISTPE